MADLLAPAGALPRSGLAGGSRDTTDAHKPTRHSDVRILRRPKSTYSPSRPQTSKYDAAVFARDRRDAAEAAATSRLSENVETLADCLSSFLLSTSDFQPCSSRQQNSLRELGKDKHTALSMKLGATGAQPAETDPEYLVLESLRARWTSLPETLHT